MARKVAGRRPASHLPFNLLKRKTRDRAPTRYPGIKGYPNMHNYTKSDDEDNAQLELAFGEQSEWPPRWVVQHVAKQAGISEDHATAVLSANGLQHD
jgi:hypothetical protein